MIDIRNFSPKELKNHYIKLQNIENIEDFLKLLHNNIKHNNIFSIIMLQKKCDIKDALYQSALNNILTEKNIISYTGSNKNRIYTWCGDNPNTEMAVALYNATNLYLLNKNNNNNTLSNLKQQKLIPLSEAINNKKMKTYTYKKSKLIKNKFYTNLNNFINTFNKKSRTFSIENIKESYKLGPIYFTVLLKCEVIKKISGTKNYIFVKNITPELTIVLTLQYWKDKLSTFYSLDQFIIIDDIENKTENVTTIDKTKTMSDLSFDTLNDESIYNNMLKMLKTKHKQRDKLNEEIDELNILISKYDELNILISKYKQMESGL